MKNRYEVHVDNIGCVHEGHNRAEARKVFRSYVNMSKSGYRSRASNEAVNLFMNGEPYLEYHPDSGSSYPGLSLGAAKRNTEHRNLLNNLLHDGVYTFEELTKATQYLGMSAYEVEMTDTFQWEPSYSWVKRIKFFVSPSDTELSIVRLAKKLLGDNRPTETINYGDMIELRWIGAPVIAFISHIDL